MRQHSHCKRCRIYPRDEHGEAFRGYIVSKRRYFYGLRVHLVVSGRGEPVEFSLAAASEADIISLLKQLSLDLPEGSIIHADKGYTDMRGSATPSGRGCPSEVCVGRRKEFYGLLLQYTHHMSRRNSEGTCRICGEYGKSSFEHVPPKLTLSSSANCNRTRTRARTRASL